MANGKMLAKCWQNVGKMLAKCWQNVGKVLAKCWQNQKIARYAGAFENSDYDFAPVIFETSGAVNKEGETILKQVIRFASKREGVSHTVYASRAWARFSCCVQAASAQQIRNRDFFDSEVAVNSFCLLRQATMNEPSSSCVSFSLCLLLHLMQYPVFGLTMLS